MKFLCDQMLGTLAKWLRIYGLDTLYATDDLDDNKLIEIAKKENRILITRDIQLIYKSRRENIKSIKVTEKNIDEQLNQVLKKVKIDKEFFLSRCLLCNSLVSEINKNDIKNKVPNRIFKNNENFWYCKKCDKIYWQGSHFKNMIQKINSL
ncbi:MAG: Mut7-C RNAse domain-containing protein [Thermoplasmatales archaeon]|nr:MAG: Mut7-C RNAse domain-containing protein [Thermoplasmatales archaeon]